MHETMDKKNNVKPLVCHSNGGDGRIKKNGKARVKERTERVENESVKVEQVI